MTTITILPEKKDSYRALAGDKESTGRTAGEALDSLTSQLTAEEGGAVVILQTYRADKFFNAAQQERLTELMRLREGGSLAPEEERELESLVEAELHGARDRAEAMPTAVGHEADALGTHVRTASTGLAVEVESAEALIERAESAEIIQQALMNITEYDRQLFYLYFGEGLSLREVAERLGASPVAVSRKLGRLRLRILQRIGHTQRIEHGS